MNDSLYLFCVMGGRVIKKIQAESGELSKIYKSKRNVYGLLVLCGCAAKRNRFTGNYFSKNVCLLRGRALGTRVIVNNDGVCDYVRYAVMIVCVNTKLR